MNIKVTEQEFRKYLGDHPKLIRHVNKGYDPILVTWRYPNSDKIIAFCHVDTYEEPPLSSNFTIDSEEWMS